MELIDPVGLGFSTNKVLDGTCKNSVDVAFRTWQLGLTTRMPRNWVSRTAPSIHACRGSLLLCTRRESVRVSLTPKQIQVKWPASFCSILEIDRHFIEPSDCRIQHCIGGASRPTFTLSADTCGDICSILLVCAHARCGATKTLCNCRHAISCTTRSAARGEKSIK